MNRAHALIALCAVVIACSDDAPPQRYRSISDSGEEERFEPRDGTVPEGLVCGEGRSFPGTSGASACTLDLPPSSSLASIDVDEVNVVVAFGGPSKTWAVPKLRRGEACSDDRAWRFDDEDEPSQIILCPETCDWAMSDPDSRFEIFFGCGKTCYEDDAGCDFPLI